MHGAARLVVVLSAGVLLYARAANAQSGGFSVLHFRPAYDADSFLTQPGTRAPGPWLWDVGVYVNYGHAPLRLVDVTTRQSGAVLVQSQLTMDFVFALGLGRRVEVALGLPTILRQEGSLATSAGPLATIALGDVRVAGKWAIVDNTGDGPGVALQIDLGLPSGLAASFAGDGAVTVWPRLIADFRIGVLAAGINAGARLRTQPQDFTGTTAAGEAIQFRASHEITAGFGLRVPIGRSGLSAVTEVWGAISAEHPFAEAGQSPGEWDLGLRYQTKSDLAFAAGGGLGITPGYGTPQFRFVLGAVWAPRDRDRDRDEIANDRDMCPDNAEDRDGFEDSDGCPDTDNDRDGIADGADRCPNEVEDRDGNQDDDGCVDAEPVAPPEAAAPSPVEPTGAPPTTEPAPAPSPTAAPAQ